MRRRTRWTRAKRRVSLEFTPFEESCKEWKEERQKRTHRKANYRTEQLMRKNKLFSIHFITRDTKTSLHLVY